MVLRSLMVGVSLAITSVAAAVPMEFAHQGRLLDVLGQPVDGTVSLRFRLYDSASGGVVQWEETHSSVVVSAGYYSVVLGTGPTPLDTSVLDGTSRYLAVRVDNSTELETRTALLTVPYAARAGIADNAASLSLLAGITRECPDSSLQTFDGTSWSACATTWSCSGQPNHIGCPTAAASSDYSSCKAIYDAPAFTGTSEDGQYWIDPDGDGVGDSPFLAFCLMSTAGGGWTQVVNIDTGDGHVASWNNLVFWEDANNNHGTVSGNFGADFKDATVFRDLVANDMLIVAHNEGSQLAWRAWGLSPARTMNDITHLADNTTISSGVIGSNNASAPDVYEEVVRPTGGLRANWKYGHSTSFDQARFVNNSAPAFSAPSNGDDTIPKIGTQMNVNNGAPGSWWDAGYGWDGGGYTKARMGTDETLPDPWATSNSRGLHYDYAFFVR